MQNYKFQNMSFTKFQAEDFSFYFQLVGNIDVMKMITERSLSKEEAFLEFSELLEKNKLDQYLGFYKVTNLEQQFIGLAKLEIESSESKVAEVGYMLLPEFWGKSLGSEIAHHLLELVKTISSINALIAIIDPKNEASRKILIKKGFKSKEFRSFDGLPGEILELILDKS
ncbi:GNAT family N-acetyltransferase [Acinetobacter sp. ANC 4558]|uniref:GNAT family N-acetyltransferase n=1 Tax=Acinetobacter sp. ANC 4558 TaxID=1977876 RepID=UPI000A33FDF9|nr:GNAT family N-acetyltransferase [Acinetobacter sp. ANC 4558]OTG87541.1 GNAT family N-acetyltransferase [Acinetobacter sp. ANC 4558]